MTFGRNDVHGVRVFPLLPGAYGAEIYSNISDCDPSKLSMHPKNFHGPHQVYVPISFPAAPPPSFTAFSRFNACTEISFQGGVGITLASVAKTHSFSFVQTTRSGAARHLLYHSTHNTAATAQPAVLHAWETAGAATGWLGGGKGGDGYQGESRAKTTTPTCHLPLSSPLKGQRNNGSGHCVTMSNYSYSGRLVVTITVTAIP